MKNEFYHQIIIGIYATGIGTYTKIDFLEKTDKTIFNKIFIEKDKQGFPVVYINLEKNISGIELLNKKKELSNAFIQSCLMRRNETKKWMIEIAEEIELETKCFSMIEMLESIDIECNFISNKIFSFDKEIAIKIFGNENVAFLNIQKMLEYEFKDYHFFIADKDSNKPKIYFFKKITKEENNV